MVFLANLCLRIVIPKLSILSPNKSDKPVELEIKGLAGEKMVNRVLTPGLDELGWWACTPSEKYDWRDVLRFKLLLHPLVSCSFRGLLQVGFAGSFQRHSS